MGGSLPKAMVSPSMMCCDYADLRKEVRALEALGVDYLHIDVMDGRFVPNLALGPDFVGALRKLTDIPMDIHMMVDGPEDKVALFKPRKGDIVVIHLESTAHAHRALQIIAGYGADPGVAINPSTAVDGLRHLLDDLRLVLIMTVNPGFAGQRVIPATLPKIAEARRMIDGKGSGIRLEVDGNVSFENARLMRSEGADTFVAGSSSIFDRSMPIGEAHARLIEAIS